jgi:hypothetical protein
MLGNESTVKRMESSQMLLQLVYCGLALSSLGKSSQADVCAKLKRFGLESSLQVFDVFGVLVSTGGA